MRFAFLGCGACLVVCGFLDSPILAYIVMVVALFMSGAGKSGLSCKCHIVIVIVLMAVVILRCSQTEIIDYNATLHW